MVVAALAASTGASVAAAGVACSAHEITARIILATSAAWGRTDVAATARLCTTEELGSVAVRAFGEPPARGLVGYWILAIAGSITAFAARCSARASATTVAHCAPEIVAQGIRTARCPTRDANVTTTISSARKLDVERIAAEFCPIRFRVEARFH